jgi:hypothetical protein
MSVNHYSLKVLTTHTAVPHKYHYSVHIATFTSISNKRVNCSRQTSQPKTCSRSVAPSNDVTPANVFSISNFTPISRYIRTNCGLKFYKVTHDLNIACSLDTVHTINVVHHILPSQRLSFPHYCCLFNKNPTHQLLIKQQKCQRCSDHCTCHLPPTAARRDRHSGWSVVHVSATVLQHTLSTSPSLTTTVISREPNRADWFYKLSESVVTATALCHY